MGLLLVIDGAISFRITPKTTLNLASYFRSNVFSFRTSSVCAMTSRRRRTKARMISMLAATAGLLLSTLDSMATPCSVNAYGR